MTPIITREQRQALEAQPDHPLRLIDPETNTGYVLIRAEEFDRWQAFLGVSLDVREAYPMLDEVARQQGWDDPALDVYNDLDPRRNP
jgi:hypothetical protein